MSNYYFLTFIFFIFFLQLPGIPGFGGANTCATEDSEVLIGVDLKNNYQFKADAYTEFVPTTKAGAVPIIQAWDGSLSAGDKSNSPERMYGRKYVTPTSDLFATGNGALAFLRHTCDGKLGFNMGNGLHLAFQIPKLPDFVQKFSSIVKGKRKSEHENRCSYSSLLSPLSKAPKQVFY